MPSFDSEASLFAILNARKLSLSETNGRKRELQAIILLKILIFYLKIPRPKFLLLLF